MGADVLTRTQVTNQPAASEHRFFTKMAFGALAVVFGGFATSYYLWPIARSTHYANGLPIAPSFPLIVHVHATAFTTWILLLVAQVRFVAVGRTSLHRRVGAVAAWLVPFLVATGLMTAVRGARDGWNPAGAPDALSFMIVPFGDIVVFTTLLTAGLLFRRRSDIHKRLMLLATLGGLLPAAITRMPLVAGRPLAMFALFSALVLAPAARDFWRGSSHRWLSLLVGVGILVSVVLRPLIGLSAQWHAFAARLVG
jgi:hypothetical protein